MANRLSRYYCPDCKRKMVIYKWYPAISDYPQDEYYCTYKDCEWGCYSSDKAPEIDRKEMIRLQEVNPNTGI